MRPSEPIVVYGRATSSNVQAVMWCLAELGLPYERLDYGHTHGGLETPEFLALNPHGLIPVIRDGGIVVWESCAILRYLAARYGGAPFWPEDPAARAQVDMWAEWGKTTLTANFTTPIWVSVRTPAAERDAGALGEAVVRFDRDLEILNAQIGEGPFVLGTDFTLADIVIGHVLYRYFTLRIPHRGRPGIVAYYERLCARPAYREHVMVSFEALRVEVS